MLPWSEQYAALPDQFHRKNLKTVVRLGCPVIVKQNPRNLYPVPVA